MEGVYSFETMAVPYEATGVTTHETRIKIFAVRTSSQTHQQFLCEILGSHGGENVVILGCDAV
jgi:hypothetical protein